jgi:hypothetical protein
MARFPLLDHPNHIDERAELARHASGHCRGDPQVVVNAHKITVHEVDRDRMSVVRGLFQKTVRQPSGNQTDPLPASELANPRTPRYD